MFYCMFYFTCDRSFTTDAHSLLASIVNDVNINKARTLKAKAKAIP